MIRNWLRSWLGIVRLDNYITSIEGSEYKGLQALKRVSDLEQELAKQEKQHAADINELRERLDTPRSRHPARAFQQMRTVAEIGAAAQRKPNAG
jgi:phosphoenolpyruvate carboxylase